MAAKINAYTKQSEVNAIKIEISIVEKIIFYTIIDG